MRYVAILGIVCLGTVSLASGCSDDTSGTPGGAGGMGMASSSSSGDASSSSSSGGGGGGGGGGMASSSSSSGMSMMVNGCDSATAEDHLADAMVTVLVGSSGNVYDPACIRIKKGAQVTFSGPFQSHPTIGGSAGPPQMPDSTSPIQHTTAGTSATFDFDLAGAYPYYCEYHVGMMGAVFVEN